MYLLTCPNNISSYFCFFLLKTYVANRASAIGYTRHVQEFKCAPRCKRKIKRTSSNLERGHSNEVSLTSLLLEIFAKTQQRAAPLLRTAICSLLDSRKKLPRVHSRFNRIFPSSRFYSIMESDRISPLHYLRDTCIKVPRCRGAVLE